MNLILGLVLAIAFGVAFRERIGAFLAYISASLFLFTWASVVVVTEWVGGSTDALGAFPQTDTSKVIAFGLVNLVVLLIGLAIVEAGHRLGIRLRGRRGNSVDLDAAR